jgi:hypothetical protein
VPVGFPNNTAVLDIGKQSAKGTPQTTPTYELRYTGGFGPTVAPQTVEVAESDSTSLASGIIRTGFSVEGTSEGYVRPDEFGLLAYLALGANADSGAGPFVHTASHSVTPPYVTLFRSVNTTALSERYSDCRISSLTVNGSANQILTYSAAWGGLSWLGGVTKPVISPVATTPLVYSQVTCTIGGSAPGTVQTFQLNVNNNANLWWGDSGTSAVDYIMGRKVVTGSLTMLFASDADYRLFLTGSTSGTTLSPTVSSQTLSIAASVSGALSVVFNMTNVRYNTYVLGLGVDGAPVTAAIDFSSQNLGTVAQYLNVVTTNAVTTY